MYIIQRVSITHCSLMTGSLKMDLPVGMGGGPFSPRTGGEEPLIAESEL